MNSFSETYQQLWKAIIRPPRANYSQFDLGQKVFKYKNLRVQRTDITLTNKRDYKIKCSHYQPYVRPCKQLPCVVYLHGNSSCRIEGRSYVQYILSRDITLFTFDFSGCGHSQGQYISLGYYERDDVDVVFKYLRNLKTVSSIGLWGRSMGAVTALMYVDQNPQIACIVLDSPFSNLQKLCKQLAERYTNNSLLSFFSSGALWFISKTIQQKNNFSISNLDPLGKHVKNAQIPAFFIAAEGDDFVPPSHTEILYKNYSGQKIKRIVKGDHNSQRGLQINESISNFFYNNLHVQQLVKYDQEFMKMQKEQKNKQGKHIYKQQQKQITRRIQKISLSQFQSEQQQLQKALQQSLRTLQEQKKKQQGQINKKQNKISIKRQILIKNELQNDITSQQTKRKYQILSIKEINIEKEQNISKIQKTQRKSYKISEKKIDFNDDQNNSNINIILKNQQNDSIQMDQSHL